MSYVAPNSDVWLCKGIPFDTQHTMSYRPPSEVEQQTRILSYTEYILNAQSYIRHTNNSIRVAIPPDSAIVCNYMAFRNTAFGNKMFYAFITDVEYVNNETSLITYSIDVLQTYYFDIDINPSYIEREHTETDGIGDNVMPEPVLATGQEIYSNNSAITHDTAGLYTVIVTSKHLLNPDGRYYTTFAQGALSGLVLTGAYNICNVTSATLNDFANVITSYIETAGGLSEIIAIYSIPKDNYPNGAWDATHTWLAPAVNPNQPDYKLLEIAKPTASDKLDTYTPSNKKLYTYPYCFLRVTDYRGGTKDLRYEYMPDNKQLRLTNSGILPSPSEQLSTFGYAGTDGQMSPWDNSMWISSYPTPTLSTSEFSDYYGSNHNAQIAQQLSNIFSTIVSAGTSVLGAANYGPDEGSIPTGGFSLVTSTVDNAARFIGRQQDMLNKTRVLNANNSSFLPYLYGRDLFGTYRVCYNRDILKMYDDYFTMCGYAVNRLKTPNFLTTKRRPAYNFCKMKQANITANGVPAQALTEIIQIFNSGVCLWEGITAVGLYQIPNAPTT